jgi:hypothetical protein
MGLPQHIQEVRFERSPELAEGRLYATVTPDLHSEGFDVEVIDTAGNRYIHLTDYRTIALPEGVNAEALKALQTLMSAEAVAA